MLKKEMLLPVLAASLLLSACIKKKSDDHKGDSNPSTVNIPQTPVKDQGSVGFCWSYALNGMIESWALVHKGIKVDLSEEATGFYNLAQNLYFHVQMDPKTQEDFEASVRQDKISEGSWLWKGIDFLSEYGVVPEPVWSAKFGWGEGKLNTEKLKANLKEALITYSREVGYKNVTLDGIIKNVMVGEGRFKSAPSRTFVLGGKTWTAQDYLRDYLGFNPNMFEDTSGGNLDSLIRGIKRAMARGIAVPVAIAVFPVERNYEAQGVPLVGSNFKIQGGHALIATDYVNKDGHPGAMTVEEITKELKKPASDLSYLIVKNSYGTDWNFNTTQDPGYAAIDSAYLKALNEFGTFSALLPKDIATDVYEGKDKDEPVNPNIAIVDGNDITGDIYEKDIAEGREKHLYTGFPDGSFRPKKLVTREQMISFVIGMLRAIPGVTAETAKPTEPPFVDVAPERWSAATIAWAKAQKLVTGYPDGTFAPEKPVTRAEVIAMLSNAGQFAMKATKGTTTLPISGQYENRMWDIEGHWAEKAIQNLSLFCRVAAPFNDRNSGNFNPNMKAYRNFAAAATNRMHTCLTKK